MEYETITDIKGNKKFPGGKIFTIPQCLNIGCDKPVKRKTEYRYSPFCDRCNKAYAGKKLFPHNVTPVKRFRCENEHGKLGFPCLIDWKLVDEIGAVIATHIDHINGNHLDNTLQNTMELCPICHHTKSMANNDYSGKHKH